ncbi:MAG: dihydrodipicolinate synthase family protein [Candidatus Aenigmatarchaeota archaeon]|nr:dihydrodipicolinate synthase family protein [Candidatus Aenigmarchaeota archaeon]
MTLVREGSSKVEKFEGASTALITPLTDDGKVSFATLERLVEYQIENNIHNLVPLGTTGMGPLLREISEDDYYKVLKTVIKTVDGKVPVIAGCGAIPTEEAVKTTRNAKELGADAALHDTGYKIGTSQEGFKQYFERVGNVGIPIIMYDVRGRGHPPIEPLTRIYIAKSVPAVVGIKEASGNFDQMRETRRLARKYGFDKHTFKIISGDDPNTYKICSDPEIEGVGVISVMSNLLPHKYVELLEFLLAGEYEKAKKLDETLGELNGIVGVKTKHRIRIDGDEYEIQENYRNPEAIQFAAYLLGMIPSPRLIHPLGVLNRDGQKIVEGTLFNLYKSHPEYFEPLMKFFKVDIGSRFNNFYKKQLF